MSTADQQPEKSSDATRALDVDVVVLIARTLKAELPTLANDLVLRCAEQITIMLYREGYLKRGVFDEHH